MSRNAKPPPAWSYDWDMEVVVLQLQISILDKYHECVFSTTDVPCSVGLFNILRVVLNGTSGIMYSSLEHSS